MGERKRGRFKLDSKESCPNWLLCVLCFCFCFCFLCLCTKAKRENKRYTKRRKGKKSIRFCCLNSVGREEKRCVFCIQMARAQRVQKNKANDQAYKVGTTTQSVPPWYKVQIKKEGWRLLKQHQTFCVFRRKGEKRGGGEREKEMAINKPLVHFFFWLAPASHFTFSSHVSDLLLV